MLLKKKQNIIFYRRKKMNIKEYYCYLPYTHHLKIETTLYKGDLEKKKKW